MELLGILLVLGIVLLVVAAIGHAIWLILAAMLNALFGRSNSFSPPIFGSRGSACAHCGQLSDLSTCPNCGASKNDAAGFSAGAEWSITARQLRRLLQAGRIDSATFALLIRAIDQERASTPTAAPPPVAAPPTPVVSAPSDRGLDSSSAMPPLPPAPTIEPPGPPPALPESPSPASLPVAPPPPKPKAPRRPLSVVLAGFMEEKNIRWGELIGGMLVICCSIALVVGQWSDIARIPTLRFFIFTAVTAALFGAGLYTEHRWKLPATSRGVLITASLLVPLNFLALALFSEGSNAITAAVIGGGLAFVMFSALMFQAGRVITPRWPLATTVAVSVVSASQLLIRWLSGPSASTSKLLALAALPMAGYLCAAFWVLWDVFRFRALPFEPLSTDIPAEAASISEAISTDPPHETDRSTTGTALAIDRNLASTVFTFLGLAGLAILATLTLLTYKSGHVTNTLRQLAPMLALMGTPILAMGLLLWQRIVDRQLVFLRIAGTTVAVIGAGILLGAILPAWPQASAMLPIAVLDALLFITIAIVLDIPAAHLPAGACLILAYLVGYHAGAGHVGWHDDSALPLIRALVGAQTGPALVPLVLALIGGVVGLLRTGRGQHARFYTMVTGLVATISLAMAAYHGFGRHDDHGVTWILAIYAAGAFSLAWLFDWPWATWLGSLLALAAWVQALLFAHVLTWASSNPALQLQTALLAHATLMLCMAGVARLIALRRRSIAAYPTLPEPLTSFATRITRSSLITSIITILPFVAVITVHHAESEAWRALWLAAVWGILALVLQRSLLFSLGQLALTFGVALFVLAHHAREPWFINSAFLVTDPRTFQSVGTAIAGLSLLWVLTRLTVRHLANRDSLEGHRATALFRTVHELLNPPWPTVDHLAGLVALVGFVVLVLYGVIPGLLEEFATTPAATDRAYSGFWNRAPLAISTSTWVFAGVLFGLYSVRLWEQFRRRLVLALLLIILVLNPLLSGRWEGSSATASAFRWYAGGSWLLLSAMLWARGPLCRVVSRLRWPGIDSRTFGLAAASRVLLLVATVAPILAITILRVASSLTGHDAIGPADGTLFTRVGESFSYGLPLVLISAGLIGHGLRERSTAYTFAAGLVINLTVSLAWLMAAVKGHRVIDAPALVELVQFNTITVSCYALAWFVARYLVWRRNRPEALAQRPTLLVAQVGLGLLLNALLILPTLSRLITDPGHLSTSIAAVGSVWGWLGLALALAAMALLGRARFEPPSPIIACIGLLMLSALLSFDMAGRDTGHWQAFHTLLVGTIITAWLLFGYRWALQWRYQETRLAFWIESIWIAACMALILALRGVESDPGRPWWSGGALAALSILAALLAPLLDRERYLYMSAVLFSSAATLWWTTKWWRPAPHRWAAALIELAEVNAIALLAPAMSSLMMRWRGWFHTELRSPLSTLHEIAAVLATLVMMGAAIASLVFDARGTPLDNARLATWLAFAATAILATACLTDRLAEPSWPLLYLLGGVTIALALDPLNLAGRWLTWSGTLAIPAYTVATSILHRLLAPRWQALTGPNRPFQKPAADWLVPVHIATSSVAAALSMWVVLRFSPDLIGRTNLAAFMFRCASAAAILAQASGLGIFAGTVKDGPARRATLLLVAAAAVLLAWSPLEPQGDADTLLNRATIVLASFVSISALYGIALPRLVQHADWRAAAARVLPWLATTAALALIWILGTEVYHAARHESMAMSSAASVTVIVVMLGAAAALVSFAVGRDPLNLGNTARMGYVYAAETSLALVALHLRLSMPWLFEGFFEQYWPVVVMMIAFAGVGLAEVLRRQGQIVLAAPLEKTGAFLPLLPVLGFWFARFDSRVDYSVQLMLVGLLYAALAIRRKSFGFGLLSALAGNGAFWYLLHRTDDFGFFQHPQLWLIPAGLSVLIAAHLNRERLTSEQLTSVHYGAMIVIYLASTADIFLNGVARAPWLPLVLLLLSVGGVLGGIMMRIRSFLILGTSFLLLALATMIRCASENLGWTWLWYVAGILLGLGILALFAMFEKKRQTIITLLDDVKQWQA